MFTMNRVALGRVACENIHINMVAEVDAENSDGSRQMDDDDDGSELLDDDRAIMAALS